MDFIDYPNDGITDFDQRAPAKKQIIRHQSPISELFMQMIETDGKPEDQAKEMEEKIKYLACQVIKSAKHETKYLNEDLRMLYIEINVLVLKIIRFHIFNLGDNPWYYHSSYNDPEVMKKEIHDFKAAIEKFERKHTSSSIGEIGSQILPKRSHLLKELIDRIKAEVEKQDRDATQAINKCYELLPLANQVEADIHTHTARVEELLKEGKTGIRGNNGLNEFNITAELLKKSISQYIDYIQEITNTISYVDSIIWHLGSRAYTIAEHLIKELHVRERIMNAIHQKGKASHSALLKAGTFQVYVIPREELPAAARNPEFKDAFNIKGIESMSDEAIVQALLPKNFDETTQKGINSSSPTSDYEKLKELFALEAQNPEANKPLARYIGKLLVRPRIFRKMDSQSDYITHHPDDALNLEIRKMLRDILRKSKDVDEAFKKYLFFNRKDFWILFKNHEGSLMPIDNKKEFDKIIAMLVFDQFKEFTFNMLMNSIVEPTVPSMNEFLCFLDYKTGLDASRKIGMRIIDHNVKQRDITEKDAYLITRFMNEGYDQLFVAQSRIADEVRSGRKNPHHVNLIAKPYLIHKVMIHVLKLAIMSEGRAKINIEKETVSSGKESGFEGANTVATHGYSNYLKFKGMTNLIMPEFNREEQKIKGTEISLLTHLNNFKSWILMAMHDAATYDKQNSLAFSQEKKYGKSLKEAHHLVSSYIMAENNLVKELFNVKSLDDIDPNSEARKELNLMASVINSHDCPSIHLNIENLLYKKASEPKEANQSNVLDDDKDEEDVECTKAAEENLYLAKKLVLSSISSIADNSAGIGFMNAQGKVVVDPWEEKGSEIFSVQDKKNDSDKTNSQIFFEVLKNISRQKDYYTLTGRNPHGKERWNSIVERIKSNVEAMPPGITKNKLLDGISKGKLEPRSVVSTAGIYNTGVIVFESYDGKTLHISMLMDKILISKLRKMLHKEDAESFIYARLHKFIDSYKEKDDLIIKSKRKPDIHLVADSKKFEVNIHNSNKAGITLKSIGLNIKINEREGILKSTLVEQDSQAFIMSGLKELISN